MRHSRVRSALYEYVRGGLTPEEMAVIKDHLETCRRCGEEAHVIRAIVEQTSAHLSSACDGRPPEFWNNFARAVERRIESAGSRRRHSLINIVESMAALFTLRRGAFALAGSALAIALVALLLSRAFRAELDQPGAAGLTSNESGQSRTSEPAGNEQLPSGASEPTQNERARPATSGSTGSKPLQAIPADYRMGDYFRKSKVLLVGITHMKTEDDQPIDLSKESKMSQELLEDARYLKNQPLDIRSAKLIDDLQKILIELANIKEQNGLPNVEIIRGGIHRQNLLFKIRMAEALCDSTRFIPVRDIY